MRFFMKKEIQRRKIETGDQSGNEIQTGVGYFGIGHGVSAKPSADAG